MSECTDNTEAEERSFVVSLRNVHAKKSSLTGGKGANLSRLIEAELPVPNGFCATTAAYQALIDDPDIQSTIQSLERLDPDETETLSNVSAEVRSKIQERKIPDKVRQPIIDTVETLDSNIYAVRSSATAEDLPTASFAGQHETFLGIRGSTAVLDRIRDCMASLFTERAVTYRLRNDIPHSEVDMAVVVQPMVDPEVAGVLFTADPVSGNRHIASVDANFGLGDTVVAGEISPDNARIDRRTGDVLEYEIGEKSHAIRSQTDETGGTETIEISPEKRDSRTLSDTQLRTLVNLGERVEELLGNPQDVEWALVDDEFILLQSRPITSLFPLVSSLPDDDYLHIYLNVGHQQAMPEALPPLVVDYYRDILNSTATRFQPQNSEELWAVEAGHRVYVDLTPLLRINPLRQVISNGISVLSEPAMKALNEVLDQRQESIPIRRRIDGFYTIINSIRREASIVTPIMMKITARFIRAFVFGPPNLENERAGVEMWGKKLEKRVRQPTSRIERVKAAFKQMEFVTFTSEFLPRIATLTAGVVASKALIRMFPDAEDEIETIGKGFEKEIGTQINQQLGDLGDIARKYPEVAKEIKDGASLAEIEQMEGGQEFRNAVDAFLDEFGHRATSEIDLSRPRWKDNPATLMQTIRSNLAQSESSEHRKHLHRLEHNAEEAAARLESRASRGVLGPVKKPIVRRLIQTYRGGIQLREYPKQGAAHLLAAVHDIFSEAGESLAADGRLNQPDDVWYLHKEELLSTLKEDVPLDADIEARRRTHKRYAAMTAPPLLTSEGEALTATNDIDISEGMLTGTPISAGTVEGTAHVVRDPSEETLEKGEILIAPSTDPGWTPLFLNAAGLVMEVGGRMTHGALVAREYGIPAVASVSEATKTIQTGDRIRIDGKNGTIEALDHIQNDK